MKRVMHNQLTVTVKQDLVTHVHMLPQCYFTLRLLCV